MAEIDDLLNSIPEQIRQREHNVRFILTGLIQTLIFPHPVSLIDQDGRYAIEDIVREVFKETFVNGPNGEEYPDLKETPRLKKAVILLKRILKERSNKCA